MTCSPLTSTVYFKDQLFICYLSVVERVRLKVIRIFFTREPGQGLIEYGLILILIAIVVVGVLTIFGRKVSTTYSQINSGMP